MTGALGIDHPDFFIMRAPRPSIILSAERDYKDIVFTRKTYAETQRAYALLDRPECTDMFACNDTHSFSQPRREAAVQWMQRWLLGKSAAIQEPELIPFDRKKLQVTDSGQVLREFPDALSVSELNLRRAKELAPARKNFWNSHTTDEVLEKVRELAGVNETVPAAEIERRGVIHRGDYQIEKLLLRREDEVPVPALLARPSNRGGKSQPVLYVDSRGKVADALPGGPVEQLVRAGHTVLSIDARGFGESADSASTVVYVKGDHRAAMWSLHLGKPLLGQRVEDVLAALYCFPQLLPVHGAVEIDLIGIGRASPVVLHAACLSRQVGHVTVRNSVRSWVDDVVARPFDINAISHVIPSALTTYDLPDLAAVIGDRLTIQ